MGYLAITVCAIAVTIWIIYRLANNVFHLGLKLKPLLLCAVCSLFISVIIPKIVVGFAGLAGTLVVLAVVAVIFAYFVAYYDDRDENAQLVTAAALTEETPDTVLQFSEVSGDLQDKAISRTGNAGDTVNAVAVQAVSGDNIITQGNAEYSIETTEIGEEKEADTEAGAAVFAEGIQETEEYKVVEQEVLFNGFLTENGLVAELQDDIDDKHGAEIAKANIVLSSGDTAASAENEQTDIAKEEANLIEAGEPADSPMREDSPLFNGNLDEDSMPSSLDELLDLAFTFKEQTNNSKALLYFREALKQHPTSEAAPYLIVEIANILKNKGAYDEAIKLFTEGRNLPGLQQNEILIQEFTDTIAYLRIVRNHLLQRHLGFVPYDKIPSEVFQDIDEEFREWRNLAS